MRAHATPASRRSGIGQIGKPAETADDEKVRMMRGQTTLMILLFCCAVLGADDIGRAMYRDATLFFALCLLFGAAILRARRMHRAHRDEIA